MNEVALRPLSITLIRYYFEHRVNYACDITSLVDYVDDETSKLNSTFQQNLEAVDRVAFMISNTTVRVHKYTVNMLQDCNEDRYKNISFDYVGDYAIAYLHAEHPEDDWNSTKMQEMLDLLYNGDSLLYYLAHLLGSPSASITIGHSPIIDMTWPRSLISAGTCDYDYSYDVWHNPDYPWAIYGNEENNKDGKPYITPTYVSNILTTGKQKMMTFCALINLNGKREGVVISDLYLTDFFKDSTDRSPTKNGYLIVLEKKGTIAAGSKESLDFLFGEGSYDNMADISPIYEHENSEYKRLYDSLENEERKLECI